MNSKFLFMALIFLRTTNFYFIYLFYLFDFIFECRTLFALLTIVFGYVLVTIVSVTGKSYCVIFYKYLSRKMDFLRNDVELLFII